MKMPNVTFTFIIEKLINKYEILLKEKKEIIKELEEDEKEEKKKKYKDRDKDYLHDLEIQIVENIGAKLSIEDFLIDLNKFKRFKQNGENKK